jgi:hypothetical protein
MGELTIKETAEALGCSVATVRRRIKAGDIKAELREGPYGETYYILEKDLVKAAEIQEVIPVKRELNIEQVQRLFMESIQIATQPLMDKLEQQAEIIKEQSKRIESLEKFINLSAIRDTKLLQDVKDKVDEQEKLAWDRDKKLMETIRELQQKKKKWWKFWK